MKARFLALWIAAVLACAAAFVAHLALRFETVRLGYEVGDARREQRRLIETRRLLAIEAATLRQSARVEAVARGTLKMDVPEPDRIVPVGARTGRVRGAGRTR
jgi:cell division protein FtsL